MPAAVRRVAAAAPAPIAGGAPSASTAGGGQSGGPQIQRGQAGHGRASGTTESWQETVRQSLDDYRGPLDMEHRVPPHLDLLLFMDYLDLFFMRTIRDIVMVPTVDTLEGNLALNLLRPRAHHLSARLDHGVGAVEGGLLPRILDPYVIATPHQPARQPVNPFWSDRGQVPEPGTRSDRGRHPHEETRRSPTAQERRRRTALCEGPIPHPSSRWTVRGTS